MTRMTWTRRRRVAAMAAVAAVSLSGLLLSPQRTAGGLPRLLMGSLEEARRGDQVEAMRTLAASRGDTGRQSTDLRLLESAQRSQLTEHKRSLAAEQHDKADALRGLICQQRMRWPLCLPPFPIPILTADTHGTERAESKSRKGMSGMAKLFKEALSEQHTDASVQTRHFARDFKARYSEQKHAKRTARLSAVQPWTRVPLLQCLEPAPTHILSSKHQHMMRTTPGGKKGGQHSQRAADGVRLAVRLIVVCVEKKPEKKDP